MFCGVAQSGVFGLASNPSALTQLIGIGRDSGDTALHFLSRGTGATLKQQVPGTGDAGDQLIIYKLLIENDAEDVFRMTLTRYTPTQVIPAVTVDIGAANAPTFLNVAGTSQGVAAFTINPLATANTANILMGRVSGFVYAGDF
jgi:hypothetical protein